MNLDPDEFESGVVIKGVFIDPRGPDCDAPHLACIIHGADDDIFDLLRRRERRKGNTARPGARANAADRV